MRRLRLKLNFTTINKINGKIGKKVHTNKSKRQQRWRWQKRHKLYACASLNARGEKKCQHPKQTDRSVFICHWLYKWISQSKCLERIHFQMRWNKRNLTLTTVWRMVFGSGDFFRMLSICLHDFSCKFSTSIPICLWYGSVDTLKIRENSLKFLQLWEKQRRNAMKIKWNGLHFM